MTRKDVEDFIYKLWMRERPRGVFLGDLHRRYKVPKEPYYIAFTKEEFLTILKEARQMGILEAHLTGHPIVIPESLAEHKGVIQTLLESVND